MDMSDPESINAFFNVLDKGGKAVDSAGKAVDSAGKAAKRVKEFFSSSKMSGDSEFRLLISELTNEIEPPWVYRRL